MIHGDIKINDVAVGRWEAERVEQIFEKTNRYDCRVYYRNNEGHPLHAEFQVVHYEPMGALSLAKSILGMGFGKLKGYPPGTDEEFPV